ncbi:MAG TPA: alpha/beta hydrolase [Anaeromyxobacter sp.]|nr:alpha/beta hydrolase [Anaeromyxobacter sp.]
MIRRRFAPLLGCSLLAGCASLRAPVPMTSRADALPGGPAKCLFVFLPGMGDEAKTFFDERFVALTRERGLSVDLIAADATLGYHTSGTFAERLEADVLGPARQKGYARTWLIGPSMGGFGSLFYASQRPGEVDGVLALAPYLGDRELIEEIEQAGGLERWSAPPAAPSDAHNFQQQLWRWLKGVAVEGLPGPVIWLGWGTEDRRLRDASQVLAQALPPERVLRTSGGHDWGPWRALFVEFLDRSPEVRECAR